MPKKPKPDKQRKDKEDKRDETIATLDASEEPARIDAVLDEDQLAIRPDAAERLDVFREGNLEGLQKEAEKFGPDATGHITDNLGNEIARHDGPGIADMFKSGAEYGLTGTDDVDPLTGQPQIPDKDDGPDTPFRKNDPDLVSAGAKGETTASDLQGFLGIGGGAAKDTGGVEGHKYNLMGHKGYLDNTLGPAGKAAQDADPDAKAAADKAAADKAAADKAAADKAAADKAAADKAAADKAAGDKPKKEGSHEKGGDKEHDKDTTYTTGEVEWTPQINTLESGPLLTDHDRLGHRVDPGDETVFEIDKSQIDAVIKEHTTHGSQILTSAEELPATVDLSVPPTVPGSELENHGNPLDAEAPAVPPGGSTTGPPSGGGGGETAFEAPTATIDTGALEAAPQQATAPAVPGGDDFAAPAPGAEQAAPVPGGADLGDDPDGDGMPG